LNDLSGTETVSAQAPAWGRARRLNLQSLLLQASFMCIGIGQTLIYTIMPALGRQFHLSEVQVGGIFLLSSLLWVVTTPWWGRRSDIWGRRRVLVFGLAGFALSFVLFAGTADLLRFDWVPVFMAYGLLIGFRCLFGLLGSGIMPAGLAYVADRTMGPERTRAVAGLTAANAFGNIVGPGLGAALTVISLTAPFYGLALLVALLAIGVHFRLDGRVPAETGRGRPTLSMLDRRIWRALLIGVVAGTGQAIMVQSVEFYFMDVFALPVSAAVHVVGLALMLVAAAALIAQAVVFPMLRLAAGTGELLGLIIGLMAYAGFLMAGHTAPAILALVATGFGYGLCRPGNVARASLAVGPSEQGGVAGLTGSAWAIGYILVPILVMPLYHLAPRLPYMVVVGLMAVAVLLSATDRYRLRRAG
jgi:MFS family permease